MGSITTIRYSTDALPRLCTAAHCKNSPMPGHAMCAGCLRRREEGLPIYGKHRIPGPEETLRRAGRCYVYAIEAMTSGAIKIGRALNVKHRLDNLQSSNPEELRERGRVRGTPELEQLILLALLPHRIRGEWHRPEPEVMEVVKLIEEKEDKILWLLAANRLPEDEELRELLLS